MAWKSRLVNKRPPSPNHSTCDACASHQPTHQQNGSGNENVPPNGEGLIDPRRGVPDESPLGDFARWVVLLHVAPEIIEDTNEVSIKIGGHKLAQLPRLSSGSETIFACAAFHCAKSSSTSARRSRMAFSCDLPNRPATVSVRVRWQRHSYSTDERDVDLH